MNVLLDTDETLFCGKCAGMILPEENKIILGECTVHGRQILVVLHPECLYGKD